MSADAKPFIKWVGGKRQLLPELVPHITRWLCSHDPLKNAYHEPFLGGGALFFHTSSVPMLRFARNHLSDVNERLVRTYRGIKKDVGQVIELLGGYRYERAFYDEMRSRPIDCGTDVEVAAWFIYLNRCGFNGLYRVNKKNGFNVPFGRYKKPLICDRVTLLAAAHVLRQSELYVSNYESVLRRAEPGDFVYFDPPYVPLSATSNFTSYTADGFDDAEQVHLRDTAVRLRERGVTVVLSNSAAPRVLELYSDFNVHTVEARRSLNSKGDKRSAINEVVIS